MKVNEKTKAVFLLLFFGIFNACSSHHPANGLSGNYLPPHDSEIINIDSTTRLTPNKTAVTEVSIVSWNLKDFGASKSEVTMEFIANTVKDFDILIIQEVVGKDPGGAQAVARLCSVLNRKGAKWDYAISDITSSTTFKAERYAYVWKPSRVTISGRPWLEKQYNLEIEREPFFATFALLDKKFTLVNFHAITKSKQPETEIKYFKYLPEEYPELNLIFVGDFNCPQSHSVFIPLRKMGYASVFTNQKTSLRKSCINLDCLASEFDNIFYDRSKVNLLGSDVIHFYRNFGSLKEAEMVSDHIPIFFKCTLK